MIRAAQVRRGLAHWISANVPDAVWSETEPYGPDDRAIALRDLPSQPATAVAIELYHRDDDLILPDTEVRVQLMFRGPGDAADDFGDDVFEALHGRQMFTAGTVKVQRAARVSSAPLGPDENRRERRSDNYEFLLMRQVSEG